MLSTITLLNQSLYRARRFTVNHIQTTDDKTQAASILTFHKYTTFTVCRLFINICIHVWFLEMMSVWQGPELQNKATCVLTKLYIWTVAWYSHSQLQTFWIIIKQNIIVYSYLMSTQPVMLTQTSSEVSVNRKNTAVQSFSCKNIPYHNLTQLYCSELSTIDLRN